MLRVLTQGVHGGQVAGQRGIMEDEIVPSRQLRDALNRPVSNKRCMDKPYGTVPLVARLPTFPGRTIPPVFRPASRSPCKLEFLVRFLDYCGCLAIKAQYWTGMRIAWHREREEGQDGVVWLSPVH